MTCTDCGNTTAPGKERCQRCEDRAPKHDVVTTQQDGENIDICRRCGDGKDEREENDCYEHKLDDCSICGERGCYITCSECNNLICDNDTCVHTGGIDSGRCTKCVPDTVQVDVDPYGSNIILKIFCDGIHGTQDVILESPQGHEGPDLCVRCGLPYKAALFSGPSKYVGVAMDTPQPGEPSVVEDDCGMCGAPCVVVDDNTYQYKAPDEDPTADIKNKLYAAMRSDNPDDLYRVVEAILGIKDVENLESFDLAEIPTMKPGPFKAP